MVLRQFEKLGDSNIVVANLRSLTDPPPWKSITLGYYPSERRYPSGLFVYAASGWIKDAMGHDEFHEVAIDEGVLCEDCMHEVPPWGGTLILNRHGEFMLGERSAERCYGLDGKVLDRFIDHITELYVTMYTPTTRKRG